MVALFVLEGHKVGSIWGGDVGKEEEFTENRRDGRVFY